MPEELWRAHSFEKNKDSDGGTTTSGSFSYWADDPLEELKSYDFDDGPEFWPLASDPINTKGLNREDKDGPSVKIKKVSVSDSVIGMKNGKPFRQWQVTVEGDSSDSGDGDNTKVRYTFNLSKGDGGKIHSTGSMEVTNDGDAPAITLSIGGTFHVPGVGTVTCTGIGGGDEWTDKGVHRWTVTYEGGSWDESGSGAETHDKYTYSVKKEDGETKITGTRETVQDSASSALADFSIPGVGNFTCTGVSGSDEWTEDGVQRWTITYEATATSEGGVGGGADAEVKWSLERYQTDNGVIFKKGSKEVRLTPTNSQNAPAFGVDIGGTISSVPIFGSLKCTRVSASDEWLDSGKCRWTMTYEGADVDATGLNTAGQTGDENYELNGLTTRAVNGEFVVLQRSNSPVVKKNIVRYSDTAGVNTNEMPGKELDGGIITSHRVAAEEIKENGVPLKTLYRHDIAIEV